MVFGYNKMLLGFMKNKIIDYIKKFNWLYVNNMR